MDKTARTVFAALLVLIPLAASAQNHPALRQIDPITVTELRQWDARVDRMVRDRDLRVREVVEDFAIPGRTHQRVDQYYQGVKVFGGGLTRQIASGQTISMYGTIYSPIDIEVTPKLTAADAVRLLKELAGVAPGESHAPELVILPLEGGGYALTWKARVMTPGALTMYFLDARTGKVVKQLSDLKTQSAALGYGVGVLGDQRKMSVQSVAGAYMAIDPLRPPQIVTFDMKGNVGRTIDFLNGDLGLNMSDVATDPDNNWTDAAVVDAHAYAGFTYDYFYKRFNRHGLDNRDLRILSLVHPVKRSDLFTYPDQIVSIFYLNAFYAGGGVMVYGEGLPPGYTYGHQVVDFFAGGLDVVAHELTHGVTDFTSQLIYENESGALNEAFSDVMATGVEFMIESINPLPGQQPDYVMGEDIFRPGGIRSIANPKASGDPDNYSIRYRGAEDNGGVHTNSLIASHAYYLAIEGGTNRTSGLSVQGVGAANREQIEKVFYRAFTLLLPANATFSTARQATIQSARDLYGGGTAAERAVTQAWTAVGVQ